MKEEINIYNLIGKYVLLTNIRAIGIFVVVYLIANAFIWIIENGEMIGDFVSNHGWLVTFIIIYIICIIGNTIDFFTDLEWMKRLK